MATEYKKILHFSTLVESTTIAEARRWFHAEDTGRIVVTRQDGVTRDYFWNSVALSSTSATLGAALIGSAGITGITPTGGSSGAAATLANMLSGMRDSVILKSPYSSTMNIIQPTAAIYIPLIIRAASSQSADLFEVQDHSNTILSRYDSAGNLYVSRASVGSNVALQVQNTDNTSGSGANILVGVGGSSAGDAWIRFNTNGVQDWSIGSDTSAGQNFVIANSSTLGAGRDWLTITPAGAITLNGSTTIPSQLEVTGNVYSSGTGTGYWLGAVGVFNYGMYTSGSSLLFRSGSTSPYLTVNSSGQPTFANAVSMSSTLSVTGAFTGGQEVRADQPAGTTAYFLLRSGGSNRWAWRKGSDSESGSDAGSTLQLVAYTDAGAQIDLPVSIARAAGGTITLARPVSLSNGNLTVSRSAAGSTVLATISNTDNTNPSSETALLLQTGGSTAGDAYIQYSITGVSNSWFNGAENLGGGGSIYNISYGSNLGGSGVALTIDTSLKVTVPNAFGVTGIATFAAAPVFSSVAASQILAVDASKNLTSIATLGSGSIVLGTSATLTTPTIATSLTASYATANTAAAFDGSKNLISVANTGTGNNVLSASPTFTGTILAAAATFSGTLTASGSGGLAVSGGNFNVSRSNAGSSVQSITNNSDNSNAASHAVIVAQVGGASGGDPYTAYLIPSGASWSTGSDNSDSGKFKISRAATLGLNDALTIDSSLLAAFGGSVSLDGGGYFRFPRNASDPSSPLEGWCYWNTAGKHLYIHNGTTWTQIV